MIFCLPCNLNFYIEEMKFCSYSKWKMSSQEQNFNFIALFLLKKWASTFFHNFELWMVLFEITSFWNFPIISGFWMVTGWCLIWRWQVYHIDPPNCWVSYRWPLGCIKREENGINIAKSSLHKTAVSGVNWNYDLVV